MAWFVKSLVLTTLAASSWWVVSSFDDDGTMVERLVRAADRGGGSSDGRSNASIGGAIVASPLQNQNAGQGKPRAYATQPEVGASSFATESDVARFAQATEAAIRDSNAVDSTKSAQAGPALPAGDGKSAIEDTRRRLATSIQTELRRVGCYKGDVDGDWGQASQRAMKAFNQRVSATLPTEQPDYILLTLLQGHAAQACGPVCPMGEEVAGNGTCLPRAVVADGQTRAEPGEPAPWAQSLAQIAAATTGYADAGQAGLPKTAAELQRAKLAADQARLRLRAEAEARLKAASREATAARAQAEAHALAQRKAEAEKARPVADAANTVAHPKAGPEQAIAAAERARIAAADERKRNQAAEMQARAEAERLARVAESERARVIAEARRRQELEALAQRSAREPKSASANGSDRGAERAASAAAGTPLAPGGLTVPNDAGTHRPQNREVAGGQALAQPVHESSAAHSGAPKFVARYVPPPTYRVGRLPPSPATVTRAPSQPTRVYVAAPRPRSPNAVFRHVDRHSP